MLLAVTALALLLAAQAAASVKAFREEHHTPWTGPSGAANPEPPREAR